VGAGTAPGPLQRVGERQLTKACGPRFAQTAALPSAMPTSHGRPERGLQGVYGVAAAGRRLPRRLGRSRALMRIHATARARRRRLAFTRNEGVPGSSPGVGSHKRPADAGLYAFYGRSRGSVSDLGANEMQTRHREVRPYATGYPSAS